jgi:nucleotide-binding universal stress UspA family protein
MHSHDYFLQPLKPAFAMTPPPFPRLQLETVFHPSDFSEASNVAFAHALKIAMSARCKLDILHVDTDQDAYWDDFPGVRETLEQWKIIPPKSSRDEVLKLGLNVHKAIVESRDPVKGTLEYLETHPADLIVLAVRHHEGRMRWLNRSVGEPIAQGTGQSTLFIPHGVPGFVSLQDGSVSLSHILIPVCNKPSPQPSVAASLALIQSLQLPPGRVTLLYVGSEDEAPMVEIPQDSAWEWEFKTLPGSPVDTILQQATELATDLILMTTDGPDGFLDGLRGTTSERVLRHAHCPVGVIPLGSLLSIS